MINLNKKFHLVYKITATPYFPGCFMGNCYSSRFKNLIELPLKPKKVVVLIIDGTVYWFFDKSLRISAEKIFSEIFSDPQYLFKTRIKEKEISKNLLKFIQEPESKFFTKRTLNKEGEIKLRLIFDYYVSYGHVVDVPGFLFQLYLTNKLKKEIFETIKKSREQKNEIFNFLLSSYKLTNYEKFVLALSQNFNNKKGYKQIADKFYWLIHDYIGEIIDSGYIRSKTKEFEGDREILALHLRGAQERIAKIRKIKKELPAKLLRKINIIQEILYLYNERKKEVLNKVNIYFRKIIEYKYPGIQLNKIKIIYQVKPDEIIDLLKNKKVGSLAQRNKHWGYLIEDEIISAAPQKYFSLISSEKETKVIKGIPASSGSVRGKASIILNISHIYKFKKGDILVAPFTNVNYLPIMSKAKAVLTETGGLTSHAAIVSRELKKPCIVGIKNLLLSIHDGDKVEVDAVKGVVRKLK